MAAKKFYAVKKGKITGVFQSWEECREAIEGYTHCFLSLVVAVAVAVASAAPDCYCNRTIAPRR